MILVFNFLLKFILPVFLYIFFGGFVVAWVEKKYDAFTNSYNEKQEKFFVLLFWPIVFSWLIIENIFRIGKLFFYKIDNKIEIHKLNKKTTYRD